MISRTLVVRHLQTLATGQQKKNTTQAAPPSFGKIKRKKKNVQTHLKLEDRKTSVGLMGASGGGLASSCFLVPSPRLESGQGMHEAFLNSAIWLPVSMNCGMKSHLSFNPCAGGFHGKTGPMWFFRWVFEARESLQPPNLSKKKTSKPPPHQQKPPLQMILIYFPNQKNTRKQDKTTPSLKAPHRHPGSCWSSPSPSHATSKSPQRLALPRSSTEKQTPRLQETQKKQQPYSSRG